MGHSITVGSSGFIEFAGVRISPSKDPIELDIEEGVIKIKGDASITWEDKETREGFMRWLDGEPVAGVPSSVTDTAEILDAQNGERKKGQG